MKNLNIIFFCFLVACNNTATSSEGSKNDSTKTVIPNQISADSKTMGSPSDKKEDNINSREPPYYGKKFFNLYGGSGTLQALIIAKNKEVLIMLYGTTDSIVCYKGPYKRIMTVANPEGSGTDSIQLKLINDTTIAKLNKNRYIDSGCSTDGPCIASLYSEK